MTAGTIMHRSHLPLSAVHIVTSHLRSAWLLLHRRAMVDPAEHRIFDPAGADRGSLHAFVAGTSAQTSRKVALVRRPPNLRGTPEATVCNPFPNVLQQVLSATNDIRKLTAKNIIRE